jgi:hypothetical protein
MIANYKLMSLGWRMTRMPASPLPTLTDCEGGGRGRGGGDSDSQTDDYLTSVDESKPPTPLSSISVRTRTVCIL